MKRSSLFSIALVLILAALALSSCSSEDSSDLRFELNEDGQSYSVYGPRNLFFGEQVDLTEVVIPAEYNGKPVTGIKPYAFRQSSNLKSIVIPNSVTSINAYAFSDTAYYKDESNWTDGVLYIGNHLIEAKDSISGSYTINADTICIAESAFGECIGLTSITIPSSVMIICGSAFYGCTNLASITVPDSVTSIGNAAFSNCTGLTSVTIGNSVTSIGEGAFSDCGSLISITIPNNVTSLGKLAFRDCSNLTSITFKGTKTQWSAIMKGVNWDTNTGDYTVHCTDGDIKK